MVVPNTATTIMMLSRLIASEGSSTRAPTSSHGTSMVKATAT